MDRASLTDVAREIQQTDGAEVPACRYRFGEFVLDRDEGTLRFRDDIVPLGGRALDTLAALVAHAGRLVPRTELLDTVWGTTAVTEGSLSTAIKEIRRALRRGYDTDPIGTVYGRGYRFVAAVAVSAAPSQTRDVPPAGPMLVGRARELSRIRGFVRDVIAGHAAPLLITGPVGVGKSALAMQTLQEAEAAGARTLRLPRGPEGSETPLWPFLRLALRLAGDRGDQGPGPAALTEAKTLQARWELIARLLRDALAQQPLLLWLDGWGALDTASRELLAYLTQHFERRPLGLVLTGTASATDDDGLADLPGAAQRMVLGPLASHHARQLASSVLARPPADACVDVLILAAGGNPQRLLHLAAWVTRAQANDPAGGAQVHSQAEWERRIVPALAEALKRPLSQLSERSAALVAMTACIGRDVSSEAVPEAADASHTEVAGMIREAQRAGLIEVDEEAPSRIRFGPLQRRALALACPPEARARVRASMARRIERGPEPIDAPPCAVSARALLLLQHAQWCPCATAERTSLLRQAFALAVRADAPELMAWAAFGLSAAIPFRRVAEPFRGPNTEAQAMLERALRAQPDDSLWHVLVTAQLGAALLVIEPRRAERLLCEAVAAAERLQESRTLAEALLVRATVLSRDAPTTASTRACTAAANEAMVLALQVGSQILSKRARRLLRASGARSRVSAAGCASGAGMRACSGCAGLPTARAAGRPGRWQPLRLRRRRRCEPGRRRP